MTMNRIDRLEKKVVGLYHEKNKNRDEWTDWLLDNHVIVVANYATDLAVRFNADKDLSRAAALLHDIADIRICRNHKTHEQESLKIAKELLCECDYSIDETELLINDAIRFHSCHGNQRPKSLEGKILSTADSLAHLKTDFYVYAVWARGKDGDNLKDVKDWVLKKIDRDYNDKIQFDEVRNEVKPDYDRIKTLFSR